MTRRILTPRERPPPGQAATRANLAKIGAVYAVFLGTWAVNLAVPLAATPWFPTYTHRSFFVAMVLASAAAAYLIAVKRRLIPSALIAAAVLSVLVWTPWTALFTFVSFYGAALVFAGARHRIRASPHAIRGVLVSVLLGVGIGVPLATVNVFAGTGGDLGALVIGDPLDAAARALGPGVSEEVIFRYLPFALCVYLTRDTLQQGAVRGLCFGLLVVPHVMIHLPDLFLSNPIEALVSLGMLSLLFAVPMAVLQLKRDLLAAVSLHWFIDFVRFLLIGV